MSTPTVNNENEAPVATGLNDLALLQATMSRLVTSLTPGVRRGDEAAAAAAPKVTAPVTGNRAPRKRKERPMTTPALHPLASNAPTWDSLLAVATQLGEEAGKGKDTQIKFDLKVIEAAYLGALSLDPNKHGKDRRDGMMLAEAYTRAQTGSTVFDAKADKSRKLISNVDKCIKLGSNPKWGMGQPLQNVNELVTFRQTLRKDPTKSKKLDDAHNMLMRYATAQLKSDQLIDGDQRNAFAFKKDPEEVSIEEVYEAIRKKATNLKNGKVSHCNGADNAPELQKIIDACSKRLKDIAKARGVNAATV